MPHATTTRLICIASLFSVGLALVLVVSLNIQAGSGIATFDTPILQWFTEHRTPVLTTFMLGTTAAMGAEVLIAAAAVGAAIWWRRTKEVWRPALFAVSFAAAVCGAVIIKFCVDRYRPLAEAMVPPLETAPSLPSIHTFGVAAFALILGYLLYRRRPRVRFLVLWVALAVLATALVAVTRLYLGYHWFSDIVASVGLALVTLAVVIVIDTYFTSHRAATKS